MRTGRQSDERHPIHTLKDHFGKNPSTLLLKSTDSSLWLPLVERASKRGRVRASEGECAVVAGVQSVDHREDTVGRASSGHY